MLVVMLAFEHCVHCLDATQNVAEPVSTWRQCRSQSTLGLGSDVVASQYPEERVGRQQYSEDGTVQRDSENSVELEHRWEQNQYSPIQVPASSPRPSARL